MAYSFWDSIEKGDGPLPLGQHCVSPNSKSSQVLFVDVKVIYMLSENCEEDIAIFADESDPSCTSIKWVPLRKAAVVHQELISSSDFKLSRIASRFCLIVFIVLLRSGWPDIV